METDLGLDSDIDDDLDRATQIARSSVREVHAVCGGGLVICSFAFLLPIVTLRYIALTKKRPVYEYSAGYMLTALFGMWALVFIGGIVRSTFIRTHVKNVAQQRDYLLMLVASLKVCLTGVVYSGVWVLLLLYTLLEPRDHLVQFLSFLKLSSTHLLFSVIFRKRLTNSSINLVLGIGYSACAFICYFVDEADIIRWVNIVIGVVCVTIAIITISIGQRLIPGGLLVLGTHAIFTLLDIHAGLTTVTLFGAVFLLCAGAWRNERIMVTNILALIYGPWEYPVSSSRETSPLIPN